MGEVLSIQKHLTKRVTQATEKLNGLRNGIVGTMFQDGADKGRSEISLQEYLDAKRDLRTKEKRLELHGQFCVQGICGQGSTAAEGKVPDATS